jgi:WYL_2, Sm-like SH3 beta-barrel fold
MKPSISFRKTVMLRAYHIMAETGKNWADCLRKAWQLYRINKEMHQGEVTFYFEKKDGEIRKATGTLKIDYEFKTQNQPNPKVFTYFDIDAGAFRCFKIENFIMIEKPELAKIKAAATISKTPAKLIRKRLTHLKSA